MGSRGKTIPKKKLRKRDDWPNQFDNEDEPRPTSEVLSNNIRGGKQPLKSLTTSVPGMQCQISPPNGFDFKNPALWSRWLRKFERYRMASELCFKPEIQQISMLLYTLGDEGEDLYHTFKFSDEDNLTYEDVVQNFNNFLKVKCNIVYERAKFLKRRQGPDETVDSFINDLHGLAETCEFGKLKEELIRDLIVIGVNSSKLSESLQLDESLTLNKAINKVRQAESISKQQSVVRDRPILSDNNHEEEIGAINNNNKVGFQGNKFKCSKCGLFHKYKECPAYKVECLKCGGLNHFARCCLKRGQKKIHEVEENKNETASLCLGEVKFEKHGQQCPVVEIEINGHKVGFKMDTGADVSVMGEHEARSLGLQLRFTDRVLYGPGKSKLHILGVAKAVLKYNRKFFSEDIYVLSRQNSPLLSRNALLNLGLITFNVSLVDMDKAEQLCPEVFSGTGSLNSTYKIRLQDNAQPYAVMSPRRVAVSLYKPVKDELDRMMKEGVIEPISEPTDWCSPIVVVPRVGGRIRLCVDYTKLNSYVQREHLQLPSVEESLAKIESGKFFSKLDAANGFWQIPLDKSSYRLTTFITPFGRYFFKRLPFGICSGPEVFQKRISQILADIPGVINQADDILIVGNTEEEHDSRVKLVIERLSENGVTLNRNKCLFGLTSITFLGHIITKDGISPDPDKIKAILSLRDPTNVSELRQFLGMVNQLMKFVPNLVELTASLRCLLKKHSLWIWEEAQSKAFSLLKEAVTKSPVLASYNSNSKTRITADASSYGLGAVMEQLHGEIWRPVSFVSRSMTDAETRYAQIEKEALSLTWACERFSMYILGKQFEMYTDHKPLVEILGSKPISELSSRLQRFRMRLLVFDYKITYLPGKENFTADCLSRSPGTLKEDLVKDRICELTVDDEQFVKNMVETFPCSDKRLAEIKQAQSSDPESQEIMRAIVESKWRKNSIFWKFKDELVLEDGLIVKGRRLFIPRSLRQEILHKIHEGHLGIAKCRSRAQESVWWPGCSRDVKSEVENCLVCLEHRQVNKEPLKLTELPKGPWISLSADLFMFNRKWFLVVQDYYSRFIELVELSSLSSSLVIGKLKNIFARHGIPLKVRTDCGTQFTSQEFKQFAKDYGFEAITCSPHFPQANGGAENAVSIAKRILLKNKDPNLGLLIYRTSKLESGLSPAELLYGRKLRSNLPSLNDFQQVSNERLVDFRQKDGHIKERTKQNFDNRRKATELKPLEEGDEVWIRDLKCKGKVVIKSKYPRSYLVAPDSGGRIRRNRWHLTALPTEEINNKGHPNMNPEDSTSKNHGPFRRSQRLIKIQNRHQ